MPQLVERFRTELADLIENRIPASLASQLEALNGESTTLDVHATRCKVVISLREDFWPTWKAGAPRCRRYDTTGCACCRWMQTMRKRQSAMSARGT